MSSLILPGDPAYIETVSQLPAWWKSFAHQNSGWCNFGVDLESGLLKTLNRQQTFEYIYGGELEEVYKQKDLEEDEVFFGFEGELDQVEEFYIDL